MLLLSLVLTLLATSHQVTLGSTTLFTIPLPEPAFKAASVFRGSGRLFWPVHYLLTVVAVALASCIPGARRALLVLAFGVALQFVDLAQLHAHCKAQFRYNALHQRRAESPLKSPVWRQLGETHRNLVVLPAWPCFRNVERPRYHFFGMLADSEQMNLNSYEAARYSAREREFHCRELPEQVQRGYWDPETAYVFTPDFYSFVWSAPTSHKCEEIDGFVLCYSESDVTSSVQPRAPLFPAEDRLEFSSGAPWSAGYLGLGWYPLRRFGVWSHGRATVHFRLSQEQAARYSNLRLRLISLVPPGGLHYRLLLNGRTVRSGTVADDRARTRKVFEEKIPLDISLDKNIALTLETDRPTNRRDLGISSDSPNRGLGLMWAKLEP